MTHILEELTHKMEGQPPKKEVSWVLGIYIYSLPRSHDLVLLPWPLAVFYPRTWTHRKRLWKQPSTSNHQATPDAPCMEICTVPTCIINLWHSCRYKIFVATIFNCQRTTFPGKALAVFTTQKSPFLLKTTGETVGVVLAAFFARSVGPVRATSLERLLDQHKVCRNSLLVGAQGGRLMLTAWSCQVWPWKGGKVATVISLVFFFVVFWAGLFLAG